MDDSLDKSKILDSSVSTDTFSLQMEKLQLVWITNQMIVLKILNV